MRCRRLIISVLLLGAISVIGTASIRSEGKYCGVVIYDRWDGCTLYNGVYVMYISEAVKEKLREHAGKCVEINAKDVYQPLNPGDGLIKDLDYLGPAPEYAQRVSLDGLSLRAAAAFENGQPPAVMVTLCNSGTKDVKVLAEELAPTLLAGRTDRTMTTGAFDGPSYALVTRQAFALSSGERRTSGKGAQFGTPYSWSTDAEVPLSFVLKPGEERKVKISFELPAGEYDFLAGYGGAYEGNCIASNLVAFDVGAAGMATLANVNNRQK